MKLDKYFKLKNDLETFSFERNFNSLSNTLYYFSFLGNIFLVLFSYFFIKNVTNSIPHLFPGQDLFFSILIHLNQGLIGYYDGHNDCYKYNPNIKVQHQYKVFYGIPLPEELQHLCNI